jgi:lipopolysaccharide export system permease protein
LTCLNVEGAIIRRPGAVESARASDAEMMILSRYVFRAVTRQVLAVSAVLLLIVVLLQFTRVLARAAAEHFPSDLLWMIVAWGAAQNVAVILPIGLALGIVLGLGKLHEDHEIAAMEACGAGGPRLWGPVVLLVIGVTLALAWLSLIYNPRAAAQGDAQKGLALRLGMYLTPRAGEFRSFGDGHFVLYAARVDEDGLMTSVFAHRADDSGESVVVAQSGRVERSAQNVPVAVVLNNGTYYGLLDRHLRQRIVRFSEQRIGLSIPTSQPLSGRPDSIPTSTLLHSKRPREVAELQARMALPLMALILGFIAIPLSRLRPRQGRYARAGLIVLIYFVYTNLITAGQTWIVGGGVPVWLGLWWLHVALGLIATLIPLASKYWRRRRSRVASGLVSA